MFISLKRHRREVQELLSSGNRLTDAILKSGTQGLFLLDAKDRVLPPVSQSLSALFRRQDFNNLTFEKLLAPIVTAKTLTVVRNHIAAVLAGTVRDLVETNPLGDVDVRLSNPDGSFDAAHYSFEFHPVVPSDTRTWLVRVTDITARVQTSRDLEELRGQFQTQGEILRGVLQMGAVRFSNFVQKTDLSLKNIAAALKKPARQEDTFRHKLDEILDEVDRIRREAVAFKLTTMESAARIFEDALHDLRNRSTLSGGDFLPLSMKLDELYSIFALIKSLTAAAGPLLEPDTAAQATRVAAGGTQIIEAPKFPPQGDDEKTIIAPVARPHNAAPMGSLDSALLSLTERVAGKAGKQVVLESIGLEHVPALYQPAIKNVVTQLIRNAVLHGIEPPTEREAAGKTPRGTLRVEFRVREKSYDLLFEDDGRGLVPDEVRSTAVARGVVTADVAARMRDREAIKLIFKSRYTTLDDSGGRKHGAGMSLVRRYVHEAGGKIALASLAGHETRFKITWPLIDGQTAASANQALVSDSEAPGVDSPVTGPADDHAILADGAPAGHPEPTAEQGPLPDCAATVQMPRAAVG